MNWQFFGVISVLLLGIGVVLNPIRLSSNLRAARAQKSNRGKVMSFSEKIGFIANIVGMISGILAIIQFFAGKS